MPQGKGTYGSKVGRPPKNRTTATRARGMSEAADKERRTSRPRRPGRRRP
jgi:hypothetical protein